MNPDVILRQSSLVLSKFEGEMRVTDMYKSINSTQNYATHIKDKFLELGIIKRLKYKQYELTDKGKEIQEHIRIILGGLK